MIKAGRTKILIIVPTLTPGGSERFVSILFNHLDRALFDVRLLVLNSNTIFYTLGHSEDILFLNKKDVRSSFLVLLKIIRHEKPDVILSTITSLNILLCFIRLVYPRFILVVRESTVLSVHFKGIRKSWMYELPIKILYRFADRIVCQSKDMMTDLLQHYGVNPQKIQVINNPVSTDQFPLVTRQGDRKLRLLTIARLDPAKGYVRIVKALAMMKCDFEYTIVGDFTDPRLREQFDAAVRETGLAGKIKLAGISSNPNEYLQRADVYVHGSYYEGFPNALLEAGATGLPVVSFKTTGINEILIDTVNGFIVPDHDLDAFAAAIERAGKHSFDGIQIRELTTSRFDVKTIIQKYQALLSAVVKKGEEKKRMLPEFLKSKDVLLNTTHNYINKALNAMVPVFLIPYYNKMFGVEQYGILIYIQAISILMIYVTDYGFIVTGTREVSVNANNPSHLSSLVSSVIVVKIILTVAILAALLLVSFILDVDSTTIVLYLLTFAALTFQNFMPSWFFQGMKKNFIITVSNVISKILMVVLVVIFINAGSRLWEVPFIEGVSYFLFFVVGMIMAFSTFKLKFELPSWKLLKENFALSKDNFLVTLLSWITTGGLLVLTEQFVSEQPFGYYGIFTRICYYIFIAVHQINLSIFPYVSERYAKSRSEGQALFVSISKVYMICVALLLVGGIALGHLFFQIFFDNVFVEHLNEYMPAFYWLIVRIALLLANTYLGLQFFVANKEDRVYRDYYVINTVISVIACVVLVQYAGIIGASIAACLGEAVMFFFLLKKFFAMKPEILARA